MTEWQPIETAPEEESVIIYNIDGAVSRAMQINWRWRSFDGTIPQPIYWMSLPKQPNGENHD